LKQLKVRPRRMRVTTTARATGVVVMVLLPDDI